MGQQKESQRYATFKRYQARSGSSTPVTDLQGQKPLEPPSPLRPGRGRNPPVPVRVGHLLPQGHSKSDPTPVRERSENGTPKRGFSFDEVTEQKQAGRQIEADVSDLHAEVAWSERKDSLDAELFIPPLEARKPEGVNSQGPRRDFAPASVELDSRPVIRPRAPTYSRDKPLPPLPALSISDLPDAASEESTPSPAQTHLEDQRRALQFALRHGAKRSPPPDPPELTIRRKPLSFKSHMAALEQRKASGTAISPAGGEPPAVANPPPYMISLPQDDRETRPQRPGGPPRIPTLGFLSDESLHKSVMGTSPTNSYWGDMPSRRPRMAPRIPTETVKVGQKLGPGLHEVAAERGFVTVGKEEVNSYSEWAGDMPISAALVKRGFEGVSNRGTRRYRG